MAEGPAAAQLTGEKPQDHSENCLNDLLAWESFILDHLGEKL